MVVRVCGRRTVHSVARRGKPAGRGEWVNTVGAGVARMGVIQHCEGQEMTTITAAPDWLPCDICGDLVPASIHGEEMGMCLECSDLFWEHDHEDCSWSCVADMAGFILKQRGRK